jgi:hypothetical protein
MVQTRRLNANAVASAAEADVNSRDCSEDGSEYKAQKLHHEGMTEAV